MDKNSSDNRFFYCKPIYYLACNALDLGDMAQCTFLGALVPLH